MNQRIKADLLLVATTLVWGTTFVVVKSALADAAPFPFLAIRFSLAGFLMWIFMARGRIAREVILPSLLLGTMLFAGFALQTWGLIYTTPSKAAFITGFTVILVPLIAAFRGYPLRPASAGGAALGMLGLYFLILPLGMGAVNRGDWLCLLGAISYAIQIVMLGKFARRYPFSQLASGQIVAVGIISILAIPFGPTVALHWTGRLIFAVVVTAVFASAFAFGAQAWAQQHTPPSHTALIFALEPVFAAITSLVVMGERLGGKGLLGSALILAGMVVSEMWGGGVPTPFEA